MRQCLLEYGSIIIRHRLIYLHAHVSLVKIMNTILEFIEIMCTFEVISTISHNRVYALVIKGLFLRLILNIIIFLTILLRLLNL